MDRVCKEKILKPCGKWFTNRKCLNFKIQVLKMHWKKCEIIYEPK